MHAPIFHGPDRATFRHWLDKQAKPVQGAADAIRLIRARFGSPCAINRAAGLTHYVWHSGFDRFTVTTFSRHAT